MTALATWRVAARAAATTLRSMLASATLVGAAVAADERPSLVIGGVQGSSRSSFTHLGLIEPIRGGSLGQGWFRRTMASWLTYRYDTVLNGRELQARASAPGIESGLGYAWTIGPLTADASLALGVRHTSLSADVPSDGPTGTRFTVTPQVATRYDFNELINAEALGAYSFGTNDRFLRVRLGLHPVERWRAGVEGAAYQGSNYRSEQRGAFVGTTFGSGGWIELIAGRARSRDGEQSVYVGIAGSKLF